MVKLLLLGALIPAAASAAGFSLTVGPPIAAGAGTKLDKISKAKGASFAVRLEECDDVAKAQLTARAEGLVNGARSSVAVMPLEAGSPGVYLIVQSWPTEGVWAVSLSASCGSAKAGAIVPIANLGFVREDMKFFPRPPTEPEIQQALLNADKKLMPKP